MKPKNNPDGTRRPWKCEAGPGRAPGPALFPARGGRRPSSAFSLLELLVVMAILAILLAVTIPAMNSIFGGMNLNRAAGMVTDELNLARQTALAQNRNVEVRFYRLGAASGDTNKQFRALRSYLVEDVDAADWKPITRLKRLPEPIIISASPTYSTLLDAMNSEFSGLTHSNEMVPGNGDTEYVGFFFRPDGGTSLKPASGKWFMTLHPMKGADATTLPANYFTVQVDPLTGRPRSFQP